MTTFDLEAVPMQVTREWLADQALRRNLQWLLAHADDGVIWGEMRDGKLMLSHDVFGNSTQPVTAQLRDETLLQVRLFSEAGELLVWRVNGTWHQWFNPSSKDAQIASGIPNTYDETHLLWGDEVEQTKDGFMLLREGREGLRHTPPLSLASLAQGQRAALRLRHTLAYDADGEAFVSGSRLVALELSRLK